MAINKKEPAGISDEAVAAKTGKTWAQWLRVLDRSGAKKKSHKEIAAWLHTERELDGWWAQMVTVGYEQARGLREVHQLCSGEYQAGVSKTLPVSVDALYARWKTVRSRKPWLPDPSFTVRKATASKSMRITWPDDTHVDVYFWDKGAEKSSVQVNHKKLDSPDQVAEMKAYWKSALAELAARF